MKSEIERWWTVSSENIDFLNDNLWLRTLIETLIVFRLNNSFHWNHHFHYGISGNAALTNFKSMDNLILWKSLVRFNFDDKFGFKIDKLPVRCSCSSWHGKWRKSILAIHIDSGLVDRVVGVQSVVHDLYPSLHPNFRAISSEQTEFRHQTEPLAWIIGDDL